MTDLPEYKSHLEVHALKVKDLRHNNDYTLTIWPAEEGFGEIVVEQRWVPSDHTKPSIGDYFVVYDSGVKAFVPADIFENAFKPASETEAPPTTEAPPPTEPPTEEKPPEPEPEPPPTEEAPPQAQSTKAVPFTKGKTHK